MKTPKPIEGAWLALLLAAIFDGRAATINFESINGVVPFEGMAISNQFQPYYGVSFRRSTNASKPWPEIARIGYPSVAFSRSGTNDNDTVTATYAAAVGQFFLVDDVTGDSGDDTIILDYDAPVSVVSGYILDIDSGEDVTVSAYTDATSTNALASLVLSSGDPGTGDGVATFWNISRPTRDIRRVELVPRNRPVGFDLFSSNYVPPPASAATLAVQTYPGITITGDVARPYRIDYTDKLDRTPSGTNWHVLTSFFLPRSPYLYVDSSPASSPERYYRAVALP
jgi:hypothetical protein